MNDSAIMDLVSSCNLKHPIPPSSLKPSTSSTLKRHSIPLSNISEIPVHKLKGVNLTCNGPTNVTIVVEKNIQSTPHPSHVWPMSSWQVRSSTRHDTPPVPTTIPPLPTQQAQMISHQTQHKLKEKQAKIKSFRQQLQHRMKELEDKKRFMVGAVLEQVQEEFQSSIHKSYRKDACPRKEKQLQQENEQLILQKCLSDEHLVIQDLPKERPYIVYPDEPYHFHKQHFIADKPSIRDALDDMKKTTPSLTDPTRELSKFYKSGWIDEIKKKQTVQLYMNTQKRFANEERQKVIQTRESHHHSVGPKLPTESSHQKKSRPKQAYAVRHSASNTSSQVSVDGNVFEPAHVLPDWFAPSVNETTLQYEPLDYMDEDVDDLHL